MSDMSRPAQLHVSADHADHDVLLVSQLAAGDSLEPAEHQKATALVADCAECASLADDLGVLATAVAWEPIPPRRRDFRLSEEDAAQARGSALERLMRRFTLPSANGLRPVAAGVMSLGLVLVIAGNFWPEDVFDDAVRQEAPVPALEAAPASGLVEALAGTSQTLEMESMVTPEPVAADEVAASLSAPVQPEANVSRDDLAIRARTEQGPGEADDAFAQDAGPSEMASSDMAASEMAASELAPQAESGIDQEPASKAAGAPFGYDAEPDQRDTGSRAIGGVAPDASGLAGAVERTVDAANDAATLAPQVAAESRDAAPVDGVVATAHGKDGAPIESIVTVAGLGLLLASLVLWLLVWVARRRDAGAFDR